MSSPSHSDVIYKDLPIGNDETKFPDVSDIFKKKILVDNTQIIKSQITVYIKSLHLSLKACPKSPWRQLSPG